MPEAITQYAINSTLGTDEFKPLDQIVKGQKTIIASERPLAMLLVGDSKSYKDGDIIATFVSNTNGTAKLYAERAYSNYKTATIYATINDVNYGKISLSTNTYEDVFGKPFSIKKGDVVNITISKDGNDYVKVNNLTLCADIIDGSLITIQ